MRYKMNNKRRRIYEIIVVSNDNDIVSQAYDIFMILTIILSIIPLCFANSNTVFLVIDKITTYIFIVDYVLRLITADFNSSQSGILAFVTYPFGIMAIIDLISILPSILDINKVFRYSKNIQIIKTVIINKKDALMTVCVLSLAYIFISALIVFQVEPKTFGNLFKAIYWATISLTTVGYGDIYPISNIGKIISMISSFLGIAVVALPSGIIISGYQEAINNSVEQEK